MKRISGLMLCLWVALVLPAHADKVRVPCADPIPGQYIVTLKEGFYRGKNTPPSVIAPRIPEIARELALLHGGRISEVLEHALEGFTVYIDDQRAWTMAQNPRVDHIEQACPAYPAGEQTNPPWGLDRVDQSRLYRNGTYVYNESGGGVNVYVIDTGISPHSEFGNRLRPGRNFYPDNGTVDPARTTDCWTSTALPNGHGTLVAGIAGGTWFGVAKEVSLYPLRVFGCGENVSTTMYIVNAVNWLTANRQKPAVANMSLTYSAAPDLDTAVQNLINSGVIVVIAAGNGNANACNSSPSRVAGGITVGAVDQYDARLIDSNDGPCVDLFAPGKDIPAPTKDGSAAYLSRTSAAAPHVAGAAALYLEGYPTATVSQVTGAILGNATPNVITGLRTGTPNRMLFSKPTDACYDWSCNPATRVCTFDPGCSRLSQGLAYYIWDFGDGQTLTTTNNFATHTYPAQSLFPVRLIAVPRRGGADHQDWCVNTTWLNSSCSQSGQTP